MFSFPQQQPREMETEGQTGFCSTDGLLKLTSQLTSALDSDKTPRVRNSSKIYWESVEGRPAVQGLWLPPQLLKLQLWGMSLSGAYKPKLSLGWEPRQPLLVTLSLMSCGQAVLFEIIDAFNFPFCQGPWDLRPSGMSAYKLHLITLLITVVSGVK